MKGFNTPGIERLLGLQTGLGVTHPDQSAIRASMESEATSSNIKREASFSIELFDQAIRDAVTEFYEFSAVYRENNTDRFVEDTRTVDNLLSDKGRKYNDAIRWSDDEDYIQDLRRPVSFAYLTIFGEKDPNRQVTPADFWKCLDLGELRTEIYRSPHFQHVSTILTREKSYDLMNKLIRLVTELRLNCVEMSKQNETTINAVLQKLIHGESIPMTDTIDFEKDQSAVLGNVIGTDIVKTINSVWYGNNITTTLGNMANDVKLLLDDPLQYCSPENSDNPKAVEFLFNYVKVEHAADNLRILQREFMNTVEQIDLSSRRLNKMAEMLSDIPEYNGDGGYNYSLRDITVLMGLYSRTLTEILKFIVKIALMLENSFQEVNTLCSKVKNLKAAIDGYVAKRLK